MSENRLADLLDEVERCKKLYPESSQDQKIVKLLFETRSQFEKDYGSFESVQMRGLTQEQADLSFRNASVIITEINLNSDIFFNFLNSTCLSVINHFPSLETPLESLCTYVRGSLKSCSDTIDAEEIFQIINGSFEEIHIKKDFLTFILSFVLSSVYSWHMSDSINKVTTTLWTHGNCPVCGKRPHYGMLREEDGVKVMECWQCSTRWVYPRLKCPFCETTDHNKIEYFTAGSNNICRVYICNECKKYYKVFDFRERKLNHIFLPVHHIATLSHDIFAVKEGYKPGSSLQWVNDEELILINTRGKDSYEIN